MIDLDSTLFNIKVDSAEPHEGALLVAEPFLHEEYFNHSVITLIDYEPDQPSMGIVMNRSTGYKLNELVEAIDKERVIPVFCGGPMSCDRLFFIHALGNVFSNSHSINNGLYIGGDFDEMIRYVNDGYPVEGLIRFFVGYSGWENGQLLSELRGHVWGVTKPLDARSMLTGSDDSYWHKIVRSMGPEYHAWRYHPMNPAVN